MNWIAFFSQTGSEIVNISEKIGRWPDLIVTNRESGFDKINSKISERLNAGKQRMLLVEKKPSVQRYHEAIRDGSVVTLHGWLRIVPEEICDKYEIYNGHPGLITEYPELKGKELEQKVNSKVKKELKRKVHKIESSAAYHLPTETESAAQTNLIAIKKLAGVFSGFLGMSTDDLLEFLSYDPKSMESQVFDNEISF